MRSGSASRARVLFVFRDDDVALRFFRVLQITDASINLAGGEAYSPKEPIDLGTGIVREETVVLSTLVDKLNELVGTDYTDVDQLLFDQIRRSEKQGFVCS